MTKMKYDYHSVTTWDFDGLTFEELIENLKSIIETKKLNFGGTSDAVVTVCDLGEYDIQFRFARPMTEAEILAEEEASAKAQQCLTERDRKVFEALKEKYGW